MVAKAIFYHAGCPVCVAAEHAVANAIDRSKYQVEIVHLGTDKSRVAEAEASGLPDAGRAHRSARRRSARTWAAAR